MLTALTFEAYSLMEATPIAESILLKAAVYEDQNKTLWRLMKNVDGQTQHKLARTPAQASLEA